MSLFNAEQKSRSDNSLRQIVQIMRFMSSMSLPRTILKGRIASKKQSPKSGCLKIGHCVKKVA